MTFEEAGLLLFALEAPHEKVGALVGRFTRAKAPDGASLGAMGPVEASGKVQRGDELCTIGRVDVTALPFKRVCDELRTAVQGGQWPLVLRIKVGEGKRDRWKSPSKENRRRASNAATPKRVSTGALEPEQQRHLLQMLVTGGLFKVSGRAKRKRPPQATAPSDRAKRCGIGGEAGECRGQWPTR